MIYLFFMWFFVFWPFLFFGGGPCTHSLLGELFLEQCVPYIHKSDQNSFRIGNQYPDSRYYTGIARNMTHYPRVVLEVLREHYNNPYMLGILFHSFVDEVRVGSGIEKNALRELAFFKNMTTHQRVTTLKLFEDDMACMLLKNRKELTRIFDESSRNEPLLRRLLEANASHERVKSLAQWYQTLNLYHDYGPRVFLENSFGHRMYEETFHKMLISLIAVWDIIKKNEHLKRSIRLMLLFCQRSFEQCSIASKLDQLNRHDQLPCFQQSSKIIT